VSDISSSVIIFGSFALYAILHSFLASRSAKDWARNQFGEPTFDRTYRLLFNFIGVFTLLPILYLVVWLPNQPLYSVPAFWRPFMLAGQVGAVLILAAALNKTDALDFAGLRQLGRKAEVPPLIVDGIYRWVRHPLYTGSMLFLWLIPVVSVNFFALNIAFTLYFIIGAIFEERKLTRYFGKAYQEYKARTPMFIPGLRVGSK
jgi:protein-S-isoprenylcysteine O-methyltransferase Ste14